MMNLKTCLLVTDDPDDHQAFSEALSEISLNTILVVILDSKQASLLLKTKKLIPDYIFVDMSMQGIEINEFEEVVKPDPVLHKIPAVLYGYEEEMSRVKRFDGIPFFSKDYKYGELRNFLSEVIQTKGNDSR